MPEQVDTPPVPAGRPVVSTTASAAPRRAPGTRSRAGNAMVRTRAGLLDGALRAVAKQGVRRTTMHDIAAFAGVAKATLYNHFRTKGDVWAALLEAQVRALIEECADRPLSAALTHACVRLSEHEALRHIVATEPAVVAALLASGPDGAGWRLARAAVRDALAAEGRSGEDLVLRWIGSHLVWPGTHPDIAAAAEALVHRLPAQ